MVAELNIAQFEAKQIKVELKEEEEEEKVDAAAASSTKA